MNWNTKVKVKHLFMEEEDHESVQRSMNDIADVLSASSAFALFDCAKFRSIPEGDDIISPQDYANKLLDRMYDFADEHRIWIG